MAKPLRRRPARRSRTRSPIAEKCQLKLKLGNPMLPSFGVPEGIDEPTYFRKVSAEGLERRFREFAEIGKKVDEDAYRKRLAMEMDVICEMKFPGYFLIVWDFIRYGEGERRPRRTGPRLGRRLARRVRAAHHRPRSDSVQPALRALPESGAREHAGLRRRLLHGPARARHPVRAARSTARRASARSRRSPSSRRRASSRTSRASSA